MKIFKILLAILLSGFTCSPVKRDTPMENHSTSEKEKHRRSTDDGRCFEIVTINCRNEFQNFSSEFYKKCLVDGFNEYCR